VVYNGSWEMKRCDNGCDYWNWGYNMGCCYKVTLCIRYFSIRFFDVGFF
jgi:hypothetical protein